MYSEGTIRVEGRIEGVLSQRLYRVVLANGHRFYGHLPRKAVDAGVRFASGDTVTVAMSPCDLSSGRIEWNKE